MITSKKAPQPDRVLVVSTLFTWTHDELPPLPAHVPVEIPSALLPLALSLEGVLPYPVN